MACASIFEMKRLLFFVLIALPLVRLHAEDEPLAAATVVVYNQNVPESAALAKFYAQKRNIARDHLVALDCPADEEISRDQFDRTIAAPLRAIFRKRKWWTQLSDEHPEMGVSSNSIRFVALIKGMPLKIRAQPDYPGDKKGPVPIGDRNEASVDSELAALGRYTREISGAQTNPYYNSSLDIHSFGEPGILLVCRLDAPSAATVRRMITDAIAAEKYGLWGRAYIDRSRNTTPGMEIGDEWLGAIIRDVHKVGIPVVNEETPAVFPNGYAMSDCSLYYGWYAGAVTGPFLRPEFRFVPGAIAVHIHSFSAATLRDPNANWVGPLLQKGAAATLGNVYEPYLQLTAHLDIFNARLLQGFTFAESAYMSMRVLSWMSVMVGDPLYRPFVSWQSETENAPGKSSPWQAYHRFALDNVAVEPAEYRKKARIFASRSDNGAVIEDLGMVEYTEGNYDAALGYFRQARTIYKKLDDLLRVVLEQASTLIKQEKPGAALALLRSVLSVMPDSTATEPLRALENQLAPPRPSPHP